MSDKISITVYNRNGIELDSYNDYVWPRVGEHFLIQSYNNDSVIEHMMTRGEKPFLSEWDTVVSGIVEKVEVVRMKFNQSLVVTAVRVYINDSE